MRNCLVIDLDRCSGCDGCVAACKLENNVDLGVCYNRVHAVGPVSYTHLDVYKRQVLAVRVPNVPGGLAKLLEFMDEQDANVENGYCFSVNEDYAVDVLKADGSDDLEQKLTDAGFEPVRPEDIYRID